jgi:hypothetical protein
MTILNRQSDGLHPQVIVLARLLAKSGPLAKDDAASICAPPNDSGKDKDLTQLRAALNRWIELGLFADADGQVTLAIPLGRGESVDDFTTRLPAICRQLALQPQHCTPLWVADEILAKKATEEGAGRTADLAKVLSWALAQDIYSFPSRTAELLELNRTQVISPKFILLNDTRVPGFKAWARYLGFSTDDDNLFMDPTEAVRAELTGMLKPGQAMLADEFIDELSTRIPVLDGGAYRIEVESVLHSDKWRRPPDGHLSMSLSMALKRLDLDGTIKLETKADASSSLHLTGRGYRTWARFTHVLLRKDGR